MFDFLEKLEQFGIKLKMRDLTSLVFHPEKAVSLFVAGGEALFTCTNEQFDELKNALSAVYNGGRVDASRVFYPDTDEAIVLISIAKKRGVPLAKPEQGDNQ